jgi:hypothetical protein
VHSVRVFLVWELAHRDAIVNGLVEFFGGARIDIQKNPVGDGLDGAPILRYKSEGFLASLLGFSEAQVIFVVLGELDHGFPPG